MNRLLPTPTVSNMVRRSLPFVAALSLLAACGDDPDNGTALPVLRVGSGAGAPEASMAANDAMPSSDKAMYVPANWEFVVTGELPALDSEAPVHVFADETEPTDAQLAELLDVFEVGGTFTKTTTDPGTEYAWTSWSAGSVDGSSPSITVSDDGLLSWWYSQGWQDMSVGRPAPCPDIAVVDPDEPATSEPATTEPVTTEPATGDADAPVTSEESVAPCEEWVEPTPPANVPSAAEAETRFTELMSRFGFTADDFVVESYADDWSAGAWAYVLVDGVRSSLSMSASFGENGQLTYAGGYLARPETLATYPRIGTEAGIERLRSDYGGNYGRGIPEPAIAVDDMISTDSVVPETITVEIVGVEEEYMLYWSVDGDVYLVPGYTYVAAEDEWGYSGRYTVPAIPSEYLDIVQPPVVGEPMPVEPAPVEPGEEGAVGISTEDIESFLGMSEADAVTYAESRGWAVRVVKRDGEEFPITMDYSASRVNLTIENGIVTIATTG